MEEIEPCPYCGGPALPFRALNVYKVSCLDCGASGCYAPSPEEAVAGWNRVRGAEREEKGGPDAATEVLRP